MRLGSLDSLCPYCAAFPSLPCADGMHDGPRYLIGYVHIGDREWDALFALDRLTAGLREFCASLAGA